MKLKETMIRRTKEVRGVAVGFRIDHVRLPNGKTAVREYLDHPGAVAVVPIVEKDKIVMVRQYRHPVRKITWEIPAGKLSKGEIPLHCVKRELKEETGATAKKITKLLSFWPTPAFANEIIHIYAAEQLTFGKSQLDFDEFLDVAVWPLKKVLKEIKEGRIKDSKTVIGLLAYESWRR